MKISINKDKKDLQFKEIEYIFFYKDSLTIINYKEDEKGAIVKTSNSIIDKKTISKANTFFKNFNKFESKYVHKTSLVHHVYTKSTKFIKYARNEWHITGVELIGEDYSYKFSNIVKLARIDCLGLYKNLKLRKLYKQFLKDLRDGSRPAVP